MYVRVYCASKVQVSDVASQVYKQLMRIKADDEIRTRIPLHWSIMYIGMFERVNVGCRGIGTHTRTMTACKQEATTTLLDESTGEPTEEEELARIRVANLGIAKEDASVASCVCHFCIVLFSFRPSRYVIDRGKVK